MATLVCNSGAYTIIGAASRVGITLALAVGSLTLTGTAATTRHGYFLTAVPGSYTVTGTAIQTKRISAEPAGYLINGKPVTLTYGATAKSVTAVSGSYTYTGNTGTKLEKAVPQAIGAYHVTGTAATLSRSFATGATLAAIPGSYSLTGTAVGLLSTVTINSGDYQITGTAVTLRPGKKVIALSRAFVLAGTQAIIAQSRHFPSVPGSYNIVGTAAGLVYNQSANKFVIANSNAFNLTGQPVTLTLQRYILSGSGSYSLSGTQASLPFVVFPGHYSITGDPVVFVRTTLLVVSGGSYTVTGQTASLFSPTSQFQANPGQYSLAGLNTTIRPTRLLLASQGNYNLSGSTTFLRATRLSLDQGSYSIIGTPANLIASRSGRWRKQPKRTVSGIPQPSRIVTWDPQGESAGV